MPHPIDDIDLRVLTSAPANSEEQFSGISTPIDLTKRFLEAYKYNFDYNPRFTPHTKIVEMSSYDPKTGQSKKEVGSFL